MEKIEQLVDELTELLSKEIARREKYEGKRSVNWFETEKGEVYTALTEAMGDAENALIDLSNAITDSEV